MCVSRSRIKVFTIYGHEGHFATIIQINLFLCPMEAIYEIQLAQWFVLNC